MWGIETGVLCLAAKVLCREALVLNLGGWWVVPKGEILVYSLMEAMVSCRGPLVLGGLAFCWWAAVFSKGGTLEVLKAKEPEGLQSKVKKVKQARPWLELTIFIFIYLSTIFIQDHPVQLKASLNGGLFTYITTLTNYI